MKKMINIFAIWFLIIFTLQFPNVTKAASEIDQQQTSGSSHSTILGDDGNYQTFKPAKNVLDKVAVKIDNLTTGDSVIFKINKWQVSGWETQRTSKKKMLIAGWNEFDFTDLAVTVDSYYAIAVNIVGSNTPYWYYNGFNIYERGTFYSHGVEQRSWDANFKTWGYDAALSPDESSITNADDGQTGTSGASGASNSSPVVNSTNSNSNDQTATNTDTSEEESNSALDKISSTENNSTLIKSWWNYLELTPFTAFCLGIAIMLIIILSCMIYYRHFLPERRGKQIK